MSRSSAWTDGLAEGAHCRRNLGISPFKNQVSILGFPVNLRPSLGGAFGHMGHWRPRNVWTCTCLTFRRISRTSKRTVLCQSSGVKRRLVASGRDSGVPCSPHLRVSGANYMAKLFPGVHNSWAVFLPQVNTCKPLSSEKRSTMFCLIALKNWTFYLGTYISLTKIMVNRKTWEINLWG